MGLIEQERDEAAILRAEDEAIRAMEHPTEEQPVPTGATLASLIESLTNGSTEEVPTEGRQG